MYVCVCVYEREEEIIHRPKYTYLLYKNIPENNEIYFVYLFNSMILTNNPASHYLNLHTINIYYRSFKIMY